MWNIVEGFTQRAKEKDEKYGDSCAIGALKATLVTALEILEDVRKAAEHQDPEEVVRHLRYPVFHAKTLLDYIKGE